MAKNKRYNASRLVWGTILVICFLMHNLLWWTIPFVDEIENRAYDMRINYFMPRTIDRRIVIVDIDEKSLKQEGRWPWGRNRLALLVDQLFDRYHVTVAAFDVAFIEKDVSSGINVLSRLARNELRQNRDFLQQFEKLKPELENDMIFARSLTDRDVVLGFFFVSDVAESGFMKGQLPQPVATLEEIDRRIPIPLARGYGANLPILQQSALTGGFIDKPILDSDPVIRRVSLLEQFQGNLYPSLSLSVVQTLMGGAPIEFNIAPGYEKMDVNLGLESISVGGLEVPVDSRAAMLVPYRGPQGSFPYISAVDVINGVAPKELLENTIVLIGSSATGLLDLRATPVQNEFAGVEIHANVISGILDENIIHQPDYIQNVEFVLMIVVGAAMLAILPWLSAFGVTMFTVLIILSLTIFNYYAWTQKLLVPYAPTMLLAILLFIKHSTYGYFFEQKTKARLHKSFGQYIPPELVDEMTHAGDDYSMDARSQEMTVLFSDVRGFTSISESMKAKDLAELMNELLTPMTQIIHHQRGTIDKYMGDAIMAFWGAPLPDQEHAKHAVHAALQMQNALPIINRTFAARGWSKIKIGVGINTGTMNVGNMGSEFRMAYTVMGDAVNLGSRLEGVTKKYGVSIIVSEQTKLQVPDVVFRTIDKIKVVGKDKPVEIYEPLMMVDEKTTEIENRLELYQLALSQYRAQEWQVARKNFEQLLVEEPDSVLYKLYIERIDNYLQNTPGQDWDGVYAFTSK